MTATNLKRKSRFEQFFTPARIAGFMAGLFTQKTENTCRLLDAGAGAGSLSTAFLDRWVSSGLRLSSIKADVFEIDELLCPPLARALGKYKKFPNSSITVRNTDFIHTASEWLSDNSFAEELPKYTHAILNPPYQKIRSDSAHRAALRRIGVETVNLYAAFVALALSLLDDHGQLVAIIPRSFCNGPYYRSFRNFMLQRAALRHLHLFRSRDKAFKEDGVLQENVIIYLECGGKQGIVKISTSTDDTFADLTTHSYPFDRIVFPDDPEQFIHVPTSPKKSGIDLFPNLRYSLSDLGLNVSTGPVVDFRVKTYLCTMPEAGTVPLLYPSHCSKDGSTTWPMPMKKKPNAIQYNGDTEKWLYPRGFYCVVRRFSAKEEKRRIVASIVDPALFDAPMLGFENHLNVFHEKKRGLPEALARGLAVFLNTTAVDEYFRRFSGHTQVNATDLRLMKYPHRDVLTELGKWVVQQGKLEQPVIDKKLETLVA